MGEGRGAWGERFEHEGDKYDPCIEGDDLDSEEVLSVAGGDGERHPTQYCDRCKVGPFFFVPAREFPTLCITCAGNEITQRIAEENR